MNLLRRGLKFTPTPKPNTIELKSDIQEFTRKLRLIEFFHSENLDNSHETRESVSGPLVKNKSNFYPPRNRNKFLDTTIDFINQQNLNNLSKNKTNLSKEDDFDFLKKCKRNLTKNSKLISFDVTRLYTNIPHELGLKAIEYWLNKYPELIHSRF